MATLELFFRIWPRISGTPNVYPAVGMFTAWDRAVMVMKQNVDGYVDGEAKVPAGITVLGAAIEFDIHTASTSGVSRLSVATARVTPTGSFDPAALTAEAAQDITVPGTANDRKVVRFPATGDLGITVAAGDIIVARFFHEGAHVNDTVGLATLFALPRLVLTV